MKLLKIKLAFSILLAATIWTSTAQAANTCIITDTKVINIEQYFDGNIFVYFDKSDLNCPCAQKGRMAFHKDSGENFIMSAALTALTAGKSVTARGDDLCQIRGDTAQLTSFIIKNY